MVRDISLVFNFSNPVLQFGYDMDLHTLISNVTNYECEKYVIQFINKSGMSTLDFSNIWFLNKFESESISTYEQQQQQQKVIHKII